MKTPFVKTENASLGRPDLETFKELPKLGLAVVLDQVRSAHNVGSIFRTSDAFLIECLYLCGICPSPPSKEINKTALGAQESVSWKKTESTEEAIAQLRELGYEIWAVEQAQGAVELADFAPHPNKKYALVFGNEVYGVHQDIIHLCDGVIEIAQGGTKHSLNVSVSAGVVLWHCYQALRE